MTKNFKNFWELNRAYDYYYLENLERVLTRGEPAQMPLFLRLETAVHGGTRRQWRRHRWLRKLWQLVLSLSPFSLDLPSNSRGEGEASGTKDIFISFSNGK